MMRWRMGDPALRSLHSLYRTGSVIISPPALHNARYGGGVHPNTSPRDLDRQEIHIIPSEIS